MSPEISLLISQLILCKSRLLSLKASYFSDISVTTFSRKRHPTEERLVNTKALQTSLLQFSLLRISYFQNLGTSRSGFLPNQPKSGQLNSSNFPKNLSFCGPDQVWVCIPWIR